MSDPINELDQQAALLDWDLLQTMSLDEATEHIVAKMGISSPMAGDIIRYVLERGGPVDIRSATRSYKQAEKAVLAAKAEERDLRGKLLGKLAKANGVTLGRTMATLADGATYLVEAVDFRGPLTDWPTADSVEFYGAKIEDGLPTAYCYLGMARDWKDRT